MVQGSSLWVPSLQGRLKGGAMVQKSLQHAPTHVSLPAGRLEGGSSSREEALGAVEGSRAEGSKLLLEGATSSLFSSLAP